MAQADELTFNAPQAKEIPGDAPADVNGLDGAHDQSWPWAKYGVKHIELIPGKTKVS